MNPFNQQIPIILIQKQKENRFRLLNALYGFCQGSTRKWVNLKELCAQQGIPFDSDAFEYLMAEKLIEPYGAAFTCYLSHNGLKAMEQAYENPHQATVYFPAITNIEPLNGQWQNKISKLQIFSQ